MLVFLSYFCSFLSFFFLFFHLWWKKTKKLVFTQKQMILTSKRYAEHLLAGRNTQQSVTKGNKSSSRVVHAHSWICHGFRMISLRHSQDLQQTQASLTWLLKCKVTHCPHSNNDKIISSIKYLRRYDVGCKTIFI